MNNNYIILVVDDEPANIAAISDILDQSNWNIIVANNGKNAVDIACNESPDIIIMDWDMPIMNGVDAIKVIRQTKATAGIPVIMITGIMTNVENMLIALNAGATDFITKPFNKVELIARTKSMLLLSRYNKEMLDYKRKELNSALLQLAQKNEFNNSLVSKLEEIAFVKATDMVNIQRKLSDILSELKSNCNVIDWSKFNETFIEANPNFMKGLLFNHPNLTPAELKLSALLRLNLNTKEIAAIICQTIDSVRVSRSRLRKKLNIDSEENLVNYLLKY